MNLETTHRTIGQEGAICLHVKCAKGDVLICRDARQHRRLTGLLAGGRLVCQSVSTNSADCLLAEGIRGQRGEDTDLRTWGSQPHIQNEEGILQDLEGKPR